MTRHFKAPLGALVIATLLLAAGAAAAAEPGAARPFVPVQEGFRPEADPVLPYHPSRILIQLTPDAAEFADLDVAREKGAAAGAPRTGLASVDRLCAEAGVKRVSRPWIAARKANLAAELGLDRWYLLETDGGRDALALARRFARDRHVAEATVDWRAFPAAVPNDPMHDLHWGHDNNAQMLSYDWATHSHENGSPVGTVGFDAAAEAAWDNAQGYGAAGVVIAIIDSGVEAGHPDLRQVAGYDYGDNDSNADDNSASPGHGTACAGVAAAMANNALGTAGIAGDCSIMPLKVADSQGSMYFSSIQNALYHAADNGADIASMSLGAAIGSDPATDTALQYAYNAGVTLLAATGNENASTISYPAINQYVIAVGAASPCGERKRSSSSSAEVNPGVSTDPNGYTCDGERWWGSNYGSSVQDAASAVDLIAPTILPTTDLLGAAGYDSGDYSKWFNGTSCATPYAAGVAALVKAANPSFTPAQIRDRLRGTAQDVTSVESGAGWDRYTGYGMIDADAATAGGVPPADEITVTYPNGGETLTAGDPVTVTWSWTGSFTTVAVEYSDDGGANWSFVTSSTANDGAYGWTAPSTATTQGRIRITGGTAQDASDGNFTVDVPPAGGYATLPYTTGFEAASLDQYWTTASSGAGRVLVTTANTPHAGSRHLTMDSATNGTYSQNEAWLHLDLSGESQVDLEFWWKDFADETHAQDGVYFSDDGGASFVKVQDLNGASYANNTWNEFSLDLDALAGANGLALSSTFVVKFQQYDNYAIATDGFAFDDVAVTAAAPPTGNYATVPYSTGFEGGALDQYWTSASTAAGRVQVTTSSTPHAGAWHLTMDSATNGTYSLNEAVLHLDLAAESQVDLSFWWKEFGDETHSQDGVYFSDDDGASWTKVQNLSGGSTSNNTWYAYTLDVDALAAANGLALTPTFLVKFQQYDNYAISTDGFAFDDVAVSAGGGGGGGSAITAESEPNGDIASADGPVGDGTAVGGAISSSSDDDYYWFDVTTAGNINISVAIGGSADLDWYLYDDAGTQVDRGYTVNNPEAGSYYASPGRYYLRVDGYLGATSGYTLTVTGGLAPLAELPEKTDLPAVFAVRQNMPNPFNPSTTIAFDLPQAGPVRVRVFDQRGRLVRTLVDETMTPGAKSVVWNGLDDAGRQAHSGVYLYLVEADGKRETRKMTLLK